MRSANSNNFVCPSRPTRYFGGALEDTRQRSIHQAGRKFPGGGLAFFDPNNPTGTFAAGIGRNSFRGPRYFAVDLSLAKRTGMPRFSVKERFSK